MTHMLHISQSGNSTIIKFWAKDWPLCSLEQIEALVDDCESSGVVNWESKLSVWDIKKKNWVSY